MRKNEMREIRNLKATIANREMRIREYNRREFNGEDVKKDRQDLVDELTSLHENLEIKIKVKNGAIVTPKSIRGTGVQMTRDGKLCRI